jgi:hypothetical protein
MLHPILQPGAGRLKEKRPAEVTIERECICNLRRYALTPVSGPNDSRDPASEPNSSAGLPPAEKEDI